MRERKKEEKASVRGGDDDDVARIGETGLWKRETQEKRIG